MMPQPQVVVVPTARDRLLSGAILGALAVGGAILLLKPELAEAAIKKVKEWVEEAREKIEGLEVPEPGEPQPPPAEKPLEEERPGAPVVERHRLVVRAYLDSKEVKVPVKFYRAEDRAELTWLEGDTPIERDVAVKVETGPGSYVELREVIVKVPDKIKAKYQLGPEYSPTWIECPFIGWEDGVERPVRKVRLDRDVVLIARYEYRVPSRQVELRAYVERPHRYVRAHVRFDDVEVTTPWKGELKCGAYSYEAWYTDSRGRKVTVKGRFDVPLGEKPLVIEIPFPPEQTAWFKCVAIGRLAGGGTRELNVRVEVLDHKTRARIDEFTTPYTWAGDPGVKYVFRAEVPEGWRAIRREWVAIGDAGTTATIEFIYEEAVKPGPKVELTIRPSKFRVSEGESVAFTGRLLRGGRGVEGEVVELYVGGSKVAEGRTASDGSYRLSYTFRRAGSYVCYARCPRLNVESPRVGVNVSPRRRPPERPRPPTYRLLLYASKYEAELRERVKVVAKLVRDGREHAGPRIVLTVYDPQGKVARRGYSNRGVVVEDVYLDWPGVWTARAEVPELKLSREIKITVRGLPAIAKGRLRFVVETDAPKPYILAAWDWAGERWPGHPYTPRPEGRREARAPRLEFEVEVPAGVYKWLVVVKDEATGRSATSAWRSISVEAGKTSTVKWSAHFPRWEVKLELVKVWGGGGATFHCYRYRDDRPYSGYQQVNLVVDGKLVDTAERSGFPVRLDYIHDARGKRFKARVVVHEMGATFTVYSNEVRVPASLGGVVLV